MLLQFLFPLPANLEKFFQWKVSTLNECRAKQQSSVCTHIVLSDKTLSHGMTLSSHVVVPSLALELLLSRKSKKKKKKLI